MEPFKNLINRDTAAQAGHHLRRAWPRFDRTRFEAQASNGLEGLEFKARAMQLADALQATLPAHFGDAAEVLEASLAPPIPLDADGEPAGLSNAQAEQGLAGWVVWSMGEFVARQGMAGRAMGIATSGSVLGTLIGIGRFSTNFLVRKLAAAYVEIMRNMPLLLQL